MYLVIHEENAQQNGDYILILSIGIYFLQSSNF